MITLKNVSKFYYHKGMIASGFSKVNLKLHLGEFVAITGESGSGKSTLLNVISGLDSYEEGEMYIEGKETSHYTEADFEKYRRKYISNIFQNFNLVNSYTVKENIELVMLFHGKSGKTVGEEALALIQKVGLTKYKNTKVSKLSGGQKQRVAIARALAKDTPIMIADEPTGNLDSRSAKGIMELLHEISKDKLVIVVTHNYEQVEPYVTRKIKMHDGKILEDKVLKKKRDAVYQVDSKLETITLWNKLRLGVRNAFNIWPKFLLVFFVYLFITVAVVSEYAFFQYQEYVTGKNGYNYYFTDTLDTRLIIKKKDKTAFTEEEYAKIKTISGVDYVVANDAFLDSSVNLRDQENFYFNAGVGEIDNFKGEIDLGTRPQAEDEILLVGSEDNYYLFNLGDELLGKEITIEDNYGNQVGNRTYKIVGITYQESSNYYVEGKIYGLSSLVENLSFLTNQQYSSLKILFQGEYHNSYDYDIHYKVIPNTNVASGTVIISDDLQVLCKKENCLKENLEIEVENLYYQDRLSLKVDKSYTKKNMESLLGIKDFDGYNGAVFISVEDYQRMFQKGNYQSSVFVKDATDVDKVSSVLEEQGFSVLKIRDTMVTGGAVEAMKILRMIVTACLFITLFFISYFVIRIILKSRNIYFGTIRILGATKRNCKQLLEIELLTVSNLAYFFFLGILWLQQQGVLKIAFFKTILKYLTVKDYFILYLVLMFMSYLISVRFSNKIFKKSAMTTMREEV